MGIKEIKNQMIEYRDFFGGDLLESDRIKEAKTKAELADIIESHNSHLEAMVTDAQSSLMRFKQKLGLNQI